MLCPLQLIMLLFQTTCQLCAFPEQLPYSAGDWSQQVTMSLVFDDNHIIYYHTLLQWSTGLTWTYFASPDCSVVQC